MKINEQIKFERQKLGLSREKFVKSLCEKTGLSVSAKTNQRWEEGELPTIIELQCLSEYFEVKVSDLMDETKDPIEISREELHEFGKNLLDYSQMDNLGDLMSIFYITEQNDFESVPRYDIELQGANTLLSSNEDFYAAMQFSNHLFDWIERCQRNDEDVKRDRYIINIHDDSVGSRSHFDPRTIIDTEELILIKEGIISGLYWFNYEVSDYLYSKNGVNIFNSNFFIKKNIFH